MLKTIKTCKRYSVESLKVIDMATGQPHTDRHGGYFAYENRMLDLTNVKLLHSGLDTVRQLYTGIPKAELLAQLDATILAEEPVFYLLDHPFSLSKMGMKSGFRYKLQNNALGLVILLGSYYVRLGESGTHLKIEVSPHLIGQAGYRLSFLLDKFAAYMMELGQKASAVALHLACDFQGWEPPADFVNKFVTRCRTIKQYLGIQSAEFKLSEVCTVYGSAESFTFGRADSLQVCLYRKDLEALKKDKLDYWKAVWGKDYNPKMPVYRLEVRFHHNVLQELGNSIAKGELKTAHDWQQYLPELWTYALNNNRYESKFNHIAPVWQLLRDDAFRSKCTMPVKRIKKESGQAVGRNIANFIGNLVSLYARQQKTAANLWAYLKRTHVWPLITAYYRERGLTQSNLYEALQQALLDRHLVGKAA